MRLARVVFAVVTLMYVFIIPPFQGGDEALHFFKAFQISEGRVFAVKEGAQLGDILPEYVSNLSYEQFDREVFGSKPIFSWMGLLKAWRMPYEPAAQKFTSFTLAASYSPTLYLPQAAGIFIGRTLGLPPLGQFYAGRLFAALLSITIILTAISIMPYGRSAAMAVASFPMVSYQIASFSADSVIFSLSFMIVALLLRQAQQPGVGQTMLVWPPAMALLALAKGVYVPLAFVGLSERPPWRYIVWLLFSLIVGVSIAAAWLNLNGGNVVQQHFVDRKTMKSVISAVPGEQVAYILAHPGIFFNTLMTSFLERIPVYAIQSIGRFGWATILLPAPVYVLAIGTFFLSLISPEKLSLLPRVGGRLFWLALALSGVILIETALYIIASPLAADYIQGVSGRYYIPYILLVSIALSFPQPLASVAGRAAKWLLEPSMTLLMIIGLIVCLTSFWDLI